ncbi:unnamed protein product [Linum trigynum]|uniref:Uncharacterized protein n=1 Tax=Linum trigynum TaxID=586398 RepID=A0AAV2E2U9_9ROSI
MPEFVPRRTPDFGPRPTRDFGRRPNSGSDRGFRQELRCQSASSIQSRNHLAGHPKSHGKRCCQRSGFETIAPTFSLLLFSVCAGIGLVNEEDDDGER